MLKNGLLKLVRLGFFKIFYIRFISLAEQMSSSLVEASMAAKRQEAVLDSALDDALTDTLVDEFSGIDAASENRSAAAASLISDEEMEVAHQQLKSLEKETPVKFNSNLNWFLDMKTSFQVGVQLYLQYFLMRNL